MMKRSLVLLILFIALMGCNEADTVSYKSEKGFSLLYSKEQWSLEEEPDVLMLFSKTISSADFRTNVNILVQDLSIQPMGLQDYHSLTRQQIMQASGKDTVESEKDVKISGIPAKEIIYTISQDIDKGNYLELKIKQVYLIKDNKAYLITYTSKPHDFDTFLEAANVVFETFKVE